MPEIQDKPDEAVAKVDFGFRRELAEKIEGNLASFCYQCGACVGDCPATTYGDGFNPRELMLKVLYGLGDELLSENSILWDCTNCYNCYERCPQDVKPVEVIIALKNMLADRGIQPDMLGKIVDAFQKTGRTASLGPAVERNRKKYDLPPLTEVPMEEIAEILRPDEDGDGAVTEAGTPASAPDAERPDPEPAGSEALETRQFAFFPGCLTPTRYPAMEFAIRDTLGKMGVDLVDLEGASCCPDPIYFKSKDKLSWLTVASRNLVLAEEKGLDIITNCSGCTATLSEAYHLLGDPELRAKVNRRLGRIGKRYRGTSRVRHCATFLREAIGAEAVRKSVVRPLEGLKVAIHYGCHLLKPSDVMQVDDPNNPQMMEELVSALGATPVRHRNWYLCCGKASESEDLPAKMMRDLLTTVHEEDAELLCLICPTCYSQFDHGQMKVAKRFEEDFHTPPIYYFQLLAFAQGAPYDRLGVERQRFQPECLKRFE